MKLHANVKNRMVDYLFVSIGTVVYALGVQLFTAPNRIAPGGVTGLATALHALTGIPIGSFSLLINIPLLLLGFKLLGRDFIRKTLFSTVLFTVMTDGLLADIRPYYGDKLLAALFGGAMIGAGIAMTFIRNGSTGGTDITARMLQNKFPQFPIGKIVLASDLLVIGFATVVFAEWETALYAIIAMLVCSKVLDGIIYGSEVGKMVLVISEHCLPISAAIGRELHRGSTLLSARGTFSGAPREVLLCAVRNHQFYKVKRIVNQIDPSAFLIVANAGEVLGEGFRKINR